MKTEYLKKTPEDTFSREVEGGTYDPGDVFGGFLFSARGK